MNVIAEISEDLLNDLKIDKNQLNNFQALQALVEGGSKYPKDQRVNLKNTLASEHINRKEALLIALSVCSNMQNKILSDSFQRLAQEEGASSEEIAETYAVASLLSVNNVFYRFRHFMNKEAYEQKNAGIKMSIMMKPVLGKEFFELMSLAISAVNGCEMCVKAHEASVLKLGASEDRIFDAVRLAAVVTGLTKVVY